MKTIQFFLCTILFAGGCKTDTPTGSIINKSEIVRGAVSLNDSTILFDLFNPKDILAISNPHDTLGGKVVGKFLELERLQAVQFSDSLKLLITIKNKGTQEGILWIKKSGTIESGEFGEIAVRSLEENTVQILTLTYDTENIGIVFTSDNSQKSLQKILPEDFLIQ